MREIKFRAWIDDRSVGSSESRCRGMVTGFSFKNIFRDRDESEVSCEDGRILIDPEWDKIILMQFTGLKDKNGKDIYEGDLVQTVEHFLFSIIDSPPPKYSSGEIKFYNAAFHVCQKNIGGELLGNFCLGDDSCGLLINGNIYENPELLKDNK